MANKIIRDAIHGDINLSEIAQLIIGHRHFQRLKRISQNGFLYLVYPGMKHSRFEHSIGAYHIAQKWMDEIGNVRSLEKRLKSKGDFPNGTLTNGTNLLLKETFELFELFDGEWREIVSIAALIHDLGHGPTSHTLEKCDLLSSEDADLFATVPEIRTYIKSREHIEHEDFTILYLNRILLEVSNDLGKSGSELDTFILRIACLVSKDFRDHYLNKNKNKTNEEAIILFSSLISSLFDVDRMDYLRRDSQKAGVEYGSVDFQRIMKTCVPALFKDADGKLKSGFITAARNVHVLDHFLISLFEMYTILYLHPRNISTDHEFASIISILKENGDLNRITISKHSELDEWKFLNEIDEKSHGLLKRLLDRQTPKAKIIQIFSKENVENASQFKFISQKSKRPFFKGNERVFLTEHSLDGQALKIVPWDEISLVAKNLNSESYSPQIWWGNEGFAKELEELKTKLFKQKQTQGATGT